MKKLFLASLLMMMSYTSFAQDTTNHQPISQLVEVMHLKKQISESADRMLELQAESVPQINQYKDVMSDFFHKYINWKTVGPDIKRVYEKTFTQQEIQDLVDFYKTDTGKKLAKVTPDLTTKIAKISQQIIVQHQSELQQKIMNAVQN